MERTSLSSACLSVGLKWISVWNAMYVCMYACMQWFVVQGAFLSGSICTYRLLGGVSAQRMTGSFYPRTASLGRSG